MEVTLFVPSIKATTADLADPFNGLSICRLYFPPSYTISLIQFYSNLFCFFKYPVAKYFVLSPIKICWQNDSILRGHTQLAQHLLVQS